MAHFEEVEVVAIMPASPCVYAHALGAEDGSVYTFFGGKWLRMMSSPRAWTDRVELVEERKIYRGKFTIKAWVQ